MRADGSSPLLTLANGRATVRLNRPVHHNRIEPSDIEALQAILADIERDTSVRALVLTGTGTTFCAGYDLIALSQGGAATDKEGDGSVHAFEDLVDRLEACRVPTICGLNGPVFGGGSDLALACDVRIAVDRARVEVPAGRMGVHYYHGGIRRMVTRLGPSAAIKLLVLAQRADAQEMLRLGFVSELLPTAEALDARLDELAAAVAALPVASVVEGMKRTVNQIARGDFDSTAADSAWTASIRSPEVARAAAERIARRPKAD